MVALHEELEDEYSNSKTVVLESGSEL